VRVLNHSRGSTTTSYYIYDGEKAILEYGPDYVLNAWNLYGRGIDEILQHTDYTPNHVLYYQDDHEGSVTHLTDASGVVIESYRYDAFGKPTIYNGPTQVPANQITTSTYGNRFLFTGREYVSLFGIYEYRNRAYHPGLGRFMSEDPKGFDAGDNNFFRYCGNDPIDRVDPDGQYGRAPDFKDERQWETFDKAQQNAASKLEKASEKIDQALKVGGKDLATMSKRFEKVFGPGAGTRGNMAKISALAKAMTTALRDDGTRGYLAHPISGAQLANEGRPIFIGGRAPVHGKTMDVNVDNPTFNNGFLLSWTVGHESAHSAGLGHGTLNGVTAYKFSPVEAERNAFKNLPSAERLKNPDHIMEFANEQ